MCLIVDGHQCDLVIVETVVLQVLLVSPVICTVYRSAIFNEVKENIEEYVAISLADNC